MATPSATCWASRLNGAGHPWLRWQAWRRNDDPGDVKQQVRQFYDQVGWQEVSEGTYQNAHYEDLRPVAREYIHRCHLRVKRHLKAGRALPAGCRLRADPVPGVPGIFTGLPLSGVRRYLHPGSAGGPQAHWGPRTVRGGRYCQPAFRRRMFSMAWSRCTPSTTCRRTSTCALTRSCTVCWRRESSAVVVNGWPRAA